ncbi:membrane metalloprotease [Lutibacter sp. TH_r2]|uniref:membrane metalloprotease n=1 Tax=Lutibacter sp. TH_r2 TaxID=3082083 RepID=UPI0029531ECE|nr:membrane metalloprotease [Lutibacter sp. TH_r2]MDV7186609.1 membrane metalloprotease [Lutibacter sp. TH_r2]
MKNIFKNIVLFSFLIISCTKNDGIESNVNNSYPYKEQVGYSANDILSNNTYTSILIEVMYVDGFKPTSTVLTNLTNFISDRSYKLDITIEEKLINIITQETYSIDDVRDIEDANRTMFTNENQLVISAIFLNGNSNSNTDSSVILGTAYRNTSFVVFEETVHSFSDDTFEPSRSVLETTVVLHEFCHLLGLVNVGTSMVNSHQDIEHGAHCTIEDCLMNYQIENGFKFSNWLGGEQIPELDSFCIEDLRANGGK